MSTTQKAAIKLISPAEVSAGFASAYGVVAAVEGGAVKGKPPLAVAPPPLTAPLPSLFGCCLGAVKRKCCSAKEQHIRIYIICLSGLSAKLRPASTYFRAWRSDLWRVWCMMAGRLAPLAEASVAKPRRRE